MQIEDKMSILVARDPAAETSEPISVLKPEAHDAVSQSSVSVMEVRVQPSTSQLQHEEPTSHPKTLSSVSLAESLQSASHSEFFFFFVCFWAILWLYFDRTA